MAAIPSVVGRKCRTARSLSLTDLTRTAEAAASLLLAEILVHLVPVRHWQTALAGVQPVTSADDGAEPGVLRQVEQAIDRAARNMPISAKCLARALAARAMLRRRGVAARIHLGVRPCARRGHVFHAWTSVGAIVVTGKLPGELFAALRLSIPAPSDA